MLSHSLGRSEILFSSFHQQEALSLSLQKNHNGVGQSVLTHSAENPLPTRFPHSNADWLIRWCCTSASDYPRTHPLTFAPPLVISSSLHPSLLPSPSDTPTARREIDSRRFWDRSPGRNSAKASLPLIHNSNIS